MYIIVIKAHICNYQMQIYYKAYLLQKLVFLCPQKTKHMINTSSECLNVLIQSNLMTYHLKHFIVTICISKCMSYFLSIVSN